MLNCGVLYFLVKKSQLYAIMFVIVLPHTKNYKSTYEFRFLQIYICTSSSICFDC